MDNELIHNSISFLACPSCSYSLKQVDNAFRCNECGSEYTFDESGRLDLMLKSVKKVVKEYDLDPACYRERDYPRQPVKGSGLYDRNRELNRNTRAFFNSMPVSDSKEAVCLDVGCGALTKQPYIEKAGYLYLGFDCDDPGAPIIGDAHAIPFKSDAFDLATGHVVMEHFRRPWIVTDEIFRILKPDGYFHGRVAFLEAFHESYFHMTHWAMISLLENSGFDIKWIEPDMNNLWHVLHTMFPRVPGGLIRTVIAPVHWASGLYWSLGRALSLISRKTLNMRVWRLPGGIGFLAQKPGRD